MSKRRPSPGSVAGLVVISLAMIGPILAPAQARTISVPLGKPTIQAAIDFALLGDVVVVSPGTYQENLDFNGKGITVRSTNPTNPTVVATTIIDGNHAGSVVTFKSGERAASVLKGFTLTNGSGTPEPTWTSGGGVYCLSSSPTLANNVISGNAVSVRGGGVYCRNGSKPTLTDNIISSNSASNGGALACDASSPTLTGNTLNGNSAETGGGVYCVNSSAPNLTSNTISNNTATYGGGVQCSKSSPHLTSNTIRGNTVTGSGGGVYCVDNPSPILLNNIIRENTANNGGGVQCENSSPTLTGNTLAGNTASSSGGGVFCLNYSSPILARNVFSSNSADTGGGVACWGHSSPTLTNNTLSGNSANRGGGVFCYDTCSPALKNTIIAASTKGGGLYVVVVPSYLSHPVVSYSDLYGNVGGNYVNLADLTGIVGNLSKNPLFANAIKGDFHEKSKGGRWNPVTKTWVKDTVQSPCINKGNPTSAFSKEPAPNGGRINMGAYGNTAQASKSAPVVPVGGLVLTASANSVAGGVTQITVNLTSTASVQVSVLNLAGREVAVLPQADLAKGVSKLLWSGRSASGTKAPAGRYLVRVTARSDDGSQSQVLAGLSLGR